MQNTVPNEKMIRTQISLTPELKEHAESKARSKGISISSYIRQAILKDIEDHKTEKEDLKKLVQLTAGSIKNTKTREWQTRESIDKWVRDIRKDKE